MKKFAAFDIDGTLIRWQLYHAVVDRLAKNNLLGETAREEIRLARMRWKRRENKNSFKAYETLLISEYESALHNLAVTDFDHAVSEVISEYKDQVYAYTRNLIKQLKAENYFLLAVSGSHQELISQIAQLYEFDDFVGSEYKRDNGRFTGESFIASKNKSTILESLIKKHSLSLKDSLAIGDSKSDAAMLKLVERPIAFNPDQDLLKLAKAAKWPIVVERKNVIYELTPNEHGYQLAESTSK